MDKKKKAIYSKRKETLKKKSLQLSTLCDIPVCLIANDETEDTVDTWPQNPYRVSQILSQFYKDRPDMLQKIYETNMGVYPSWDCGIDLSDKDSVAHAIQCVNNTLMKIQQKQDQENQVGECSHQGGEGNSGVEREDHVQHSQHGEDGANAIVVAVSNSVIVSTTSSEDNNIGPHSFNMVERWSGSLVPAAMNTQAPKVDSDASKSRKRIPAAMNTQARKVDSDASTSRKWIPAAMNTHGRKVDYGASGSCKRIPAALNTQAQKVDYDARGSRKRKQIGADKAME